MQNKRGLVNVRVNLFPLTLLTDQPLFKKDAVTSADGGFELLLDETDVQERFGKRKMDFFFKVWGADGKLIADTRETVIWNVVLRAVSPDEEITRHGNQEG